MTDNDDQADRSESGPRTQRRVDRDAEATGRGRQLGHASQKARRASPFQLARPPKIVSMATATKRLSIRATRVALQIRIQIPVRDALRNRVVSEHASMNHYLEQLVLADLHGLRAGAFVAVHPPTFASRGKNGTGRPTKGARAAVMLRVEPALRERMRERTASLNLTVNDYLESLVSQDISGTHDAGEEMTLDQTA